MQTQTQPETAGATPEVRAEKFAVLRKTTHGRRSRTTDIALGVRSYGWHQANGHSCASLTLTGKNGESFSVDFDLETFDAIGAILNEHR